MGYTIQQIRGAHVAAGGHFFGRGSMRFFSTRILGQVYQGPGGVYFITSEQNNHVHLDGTFTSWPRRFTVRVFNPANGDVYTAGPFNELDKLGAWRAAREYAVKGLPVAAGRQSSYHAAPILIQPGQLRAPGGPARSRPNGNRRG